MQIRPDPIRTRRLVPALAGAGLAASLLLPGVAAAQDPAATDDPQGGSSVVITGETGTLTAGDLTVMPIGASGACGTVTVTSVGTDGSEMVQSMDSTVCQAPVMGQLQGGPVVVVGDTGFGPGAPVLTAEPAMVGIGSSTIGEPGLPGVVTVAAEPARTVEVTGVDGTSVTLQTDDGWTRTVDTTTVAITLGADTLAVSDLAAGDRVQVIQVRNANDTYTITGLALILPEVMGTVGDVTDTGFTVTAPDGTQTPVVVTDETRWPAAGMPGMPGMSGSPETGLEALKDGDLVHVRGSQAEDGTITATEVLAIGATFVIGDPPMPVPGEPMPVEPAPQAPAATPEASPAA